MDCLKMLKKDVPKDMENASEDSLTGLLGNLLQYTEKLQDEIAQNAPEDKKEKYLGGVNALNEMISKGLEDPTAEVDTSGVDEFVDEAKGKINSKHLSKAEKEAAKVLEQAENIDK